MQNRVFVLATDKTPLMPCHQARARELMREGKAAVFRRYPFTIILRQSTTDGTQPLALKIDPGSQTTGMAVVLTGKQGNRVVWAAELPHRGEAIRASLESRRALRRGRRNRKTARRTVRYRKPRFLNRTRPTGWIPPSTLSRVLNVQTWTKRLTRLAPVSDLSVERVRFDTQQLRNPEIEGVEYQQGTLFGYEVREYLLEKWNRQCAYCGKKDVPLQIEHMHPRSRGGSNSITNLTLACQPCNQKKGSRTAAEFGHPQLTAKAARPLADAAAVNATRYRIVEELRQLGLPIETGSGGRTKFNRTRQGYPKAHWTDAACVGESGASVFIVDRQEVLLITAFGQGCRQRCRTDRYGFPNRHAPRAKAFMGWQTGDLVRAEVPTGKNKGRHVGRIAIRHTPSFNLRTGKDLLQGIHPKRLTLLQRGDGYAYSSIIHQTRGTKAIPPLRRTDPSKEGGFLASLS